MAVQEGGDFLLQAQIRRKPFTRKKLSKSCPNYPCFAVALIFCCQNKDPSCSKFSIWIIWRFPWLRITSKVYSKSLFWSDCISIFVYLWAFFIQSEIPNTVKWKWTFSQSTTFYWFISTNINPLCKTQWRLEIALGVMLKQWVSISHGLQ